MVKNLKAAGGVVLRNNDGDEATEILLIYRLGRWDLPKGKLEEGETIEECAAREVAEEVGLTTLPRIESLITTTSHEYERDNLLYSKTTYWYAMHLTHEQPAFIPQTEEGIERVEWCEMEQAINRVGYSNLVDVLTVLKKKR